MIDEASRKAELEEQKRRLRETESMLALREDDDNAAEDEVEDGAVANQPKLFDAASLALHGADGRPCRCPICRRVKQRRHYAKAESHPYAEAKVRRIDGAHTFGTIACYFDVIDYGPEAAWLQGARYDLFGFDVSTFTFMCLVCITGVNLVLVLQFLSFWFLCKFCQVTVSRCLPPPTVCEQLMFSQSDTKLYR